MTKLTQKRLKKLLSYKPRTGLFKRKTQIRGGGLVGTIAGYKNKLGYIVIMIDGKLYYAHRLVFLYIYGYIPECDVDHIDRNKHNNKFKNLREATKQCNARNTGMLANNKSGVKGLFFYKKTGRWVVNIKVNQKNIYLGYYLKKEDAVFVRWNAEKKYKFPNCCTTSTAYEYLKNNNLV